MIFDKNDSHTNEMVQRDSQDGMFELAGAPSAWIWVHTCPTPKCPCRSALVLASNDGREKLLALGATVRGAGNARANYSKAAAEIDGIVAFHVDIDTVEVSSLTDATPLELQAHPRIAEIATRIDGDLLDSIGSLWYRGKGLPDPGQSVLDATKVKLKGYQRGDMVAWKDVCDVRDDLYAVDDRLYEALDMYCVVPGCLCEEVMVAFGTLVPRGGTSPGHVTVNLSGATEIEPIRKGRDRLERGWTAFQQRNPNYLARFARRNSIMKSVGARSAVLPFAVPPKIGRNDSCPCGSGKKYKRCCG